MLRVSFVDALEKARGLKDAYLVERLVVLIE